MLNTHTGERRRIGLMTTGLNLQNTKLEQSEVDKKHIGQLKIKREIQNQIN